MTTPIADSGIAVQAFEFLELRPLASIGDDTADAVATRRALPEARRLCLESCDWSFASRTVTLQSILDAVTGLPKASGDVDLPQAHDLPSDFLIARRVSRDGRAVPYRLDLSPDGAKWLLAETGTDLSLRYTAEITNETLLSGHLRLAVALQLAVLLSDQRTSSTSKKQELSSQLEDALAKARRYDRSSASPQRYDGRDDRGDWVAEATW